MIMIIYPSIIFSRYWPPKSIFSRLTYCRQRVYVICVDLYILILFLNKKSWFMLIYMRLRVSSVLAELNKSPSCWGRTKCLAGRSQQCRLAGVESQQTGKLVMIIWGGEPTSALQPAGHRIAVSPHPEHSLLLCYKRCWEGSEDISSYSSVLGTVGKTVTRCR